MKAALIPRSFLGMPLQVGAEIVAACCVINKISAIYGLGALFTGHGLTPMQWITNLLAFAVAPLAVWGYFSILNRRPLRSLVYTHFYILDTITSLGFTIYFIIYWFTVAGKASNNPPQDSKLSETSKLLIRQMVSDTKGSHKVDTIVKDPLDKSMTVGQELAMTITATTLFLFVRFYFMLVLIGYSRYMVRKANLKSNSGQPPNSLAAKIQRFLLSPFEAFWTGNVIHRGRLTSFEPAEAQRLHSD